MGTPCALLGDPAGGPMMTLQYTVIVCGRPAVVLGSPVIPHGPGPHLAPVMVGCSSSVLFSKIPVCRTGDSASCGCPAVSGATVLIG